MRPALILLLLSVVSCGHTSSARNVFMLEPGESRTFAFSGQTVHAVRVKMEKGSVSVVYRYREGEEIRERFGSGREGFLREKGIVEVVVTARDAARGYVDVRH